MQMYINIGGLLV